MSLILAAPSGARTIEVSQFLLGGGVVVENNADGQCSLIEAINTANNVLVVGNSDCGALSATADVIILPANQTFAITSVHNFTNGPSGLPPISSNISIQGNGASLVRSGLVVDPFRFFYIHNGVSLSLDSLSLSNGYAYTAGAPEDNGGAILNLGTLSLSNTTISGNSAELNGGGIYNNSGTLTLERSRISGNKAQQGAGLFAMNASVRLNNSTVSGNSANGDGGGFYVSLGDFNLNNCTVSGNTANSGGAILVSSSSALITNSTLANNSASSAVSGAMEMVNSLIANNSSDDCIPTQIVDGGNNWFEDGTCSAMGQGDPKLGPLANNGGPTQTHALLAGSGAIDGGNAGICAAAPINNVDQRGISRAGPKCDIGAFEVDDSGFFIIPGKNNQTVIFSL